MLDHVLGHLVNLLRVAWNFLVVDTAPDQCVKLIVGVLHRFRVDEEVEIEVPPDRKQIVLDIIDLLLLSQHIHVVHLSSRQLVKGLNELFLKLESVLVL